MHLVDPTHRDELIASSRGFLEGLGMVRKSPWWPAYARLKDPLDNWNKVAALEILAGLESLDGLSGVSLLTHLLSCLAETCEKPLDELLARSGFAGNIGV